MPKRRASYPFLSRQALSVGGAFALAFGWVWSGALRELWFADILSGTLFSWQGGTLFFATLLAVFLAGALVKSAFFRIQPKIFILLAQLAALLPLGLALVLPGAAHSPLLPACLGLAGGLAGLYWGAALLKLPSALFAAALGITGLAALTELLNMLALTPPPFVLQATCSLLALPLALSLSSRSARTAAREPDGALPPEQNKFFGKTVAALLLAFATLGALFSAEGYAPPGLLPQCGLEAAGVLLALCLPHGHKWPRSRFAALALPLALPFALLPLAGSKPAIFSCSLPLASGTLLAAAVLELARAAQRREQPPSALAARALIAIFLALNLGFYVGARAPFALPWANAALALLALASLAALFFLCRPPFAAATPKNQEAADADTADAFGLTPAERRIAALLRQEYSNAAISETLDIAQATTRVHLRSIHKKMNTASRSELTERLRKMSV